MGRKSTARHGDRAMYGTGCRCSTCVTLGRPRNRSYQRGYRNGLRGETLAHFVDVDASIKSNRSATWHEPQLDL